MLLVGYFFSLFFFFNDTATTEIYTLSLHDALPIFGEGAVKHGLVAAAAHLLHHHVGDARALVGGDRDPHGRSVGNADPRDRKSTRLNSSHANISYAVFCLKKKKKHNTDQQST